MPLSKPAPRQHMHTREIRCLGFRRDDGLWDIEGSIADTKTYSFDNQSRGGIASGEHIHHMKIRITVDDDLMIHAAEAVTESSPYGICPSITGAFSALRGIRIGSGWRREVARVMGKTSGCTHLRDLLCGPIAVTAYQTIIPKRQQEGQSTKNHSRPAVLNTCIAYAEDGPIVRDRWPDFYKNPADGNS